MAVFDFITTQPYWQKMMPPTLSPIPPWSLDALLPLLVGDCLAFRADPGFEEWAVHLIGAVSWHWALVGRELPADPTGGPLDREVVGSISKGIATELLSTYQNRPMRVYRPKLAEGVQAGLEVALLKRYAHYGAYTYNTIGVYEAPGDYFLRSRGIQLPTPKGNQYYCLQFCAEVWADMGYPLYDMSLGPAVQTDLENSPMLQIVWGNY